ncbi:hypothetical protein E0J16_34115 [Rhizobium pisi]|uniref:hypothetical protein n=1 Tax=Rhizobium pisi TaxID=574561 RepID=UPI001038E078|nr:hypothetical protein [Rhizobium pisi]TCA41726.1 hypothetical protein E0J16_34115 [Rhizobium pisi]
MTEVIRTPEQEAAYQHLINARFREADLIKAVIHTYIVETRNLPFADRIDSERRKEFAMPYFTHLEGIEKAFVIAQVTLKISDVLWRIERQRQEAEDA